MDVLHFYAKKTKKGCVIMHSTIYLFIIIINII